MVRDERLQLLNVRAVQVTLAAALRHAPSDQAPRCIERARELLDHARSTATTAEVLREIEVARERLDARSGSREKSPTNRA